MIPKTSGKKDGCINDLTAIVPIAHDTFRQKNQSIWHADARRRAKGSAFRVACAFAVEIDNTCIGRCNLFGCNCDVNQQKCKPFPNAAVSSFEVPYPPVDKPDR